MIPFPARLSQSILRAVAGCIAALLLVSCGGGGVSANPSPLVDSPTITILPGTAVMYSGLPTTFVLSGGTGSYIIASSDQAILPISGGVTGRSVTLVPNPVSVETQVTLTVRDTGSAIPVSATVSVRPGTINNEVTIVRTSTETGCTGAAVLCSGGDGEIGVTLSIGGIPLAGRAARFDVVSGDFRFITTAAGTSPETLALTQTVVTDQFGRARVRVRVLPGAPNQTALFRVTDVGSGAFQQTNFVIAQVTSSTDPAFFTVPASVTFTGPRLGVCASAGSADFLIFGGSPPYTVTSSAVTALSFTVPVSGDRFTVIPQGICLPAPGVPFAITDSAGRTITATVSNEPGTVALPDLAVAPETVTLSSCDGFASVTVVGGTGTYLPPSSGSTAVLATGSGNTITIFRRDPSPATTSPVAVGISDGITTATVTVELTETGLGACPTTATPTTPAITANPTSATVSGLDADTGTSVDLSGGSGTFTAAVSDPRITASVTGSTLVIDTLLTCVAPSINLPVSASVTVSSGTATLDIPVTGTVCDFVVSPTSVTLNDTNRASGVVVTLSGGSGSYSLGTVTNSSILPVLSGSTLTISDGTFPSPPPAPGTCVVPLSTTVEVVDGITSILIPVTGTTCG